MNDYNYELLKLRSMRPLQPQLESALNVAFEVAETTLHRRLRIAPHLDREANTSSEIVNTLWETYAIRGLIPIDWIDSKQREFPGGHGGAFQARPATVGLALALAADPGAAMRAEHALRELYQRLVAWGAPTLDQRRVTTLVRWFDLPWSSRLVGERPKELHVATRKLFASAETQGHSLTIAEQNVAQDIGVCAGIRCWHECLSRDVQAHMQFQKARANNVQIGTTSVHSMPDFTAPLLAVWETGFGLATGYLHGFRLVAWTPRSSDTKRA